MTIEEIEARLDAGCATDDDMARLIRSHKILGPAAIWQCDETGCLGPNGEVLAGTFFNCHDDCVVGKARRLEL